MAEPVPQSLRQFVALNAEYSILICTNEKCKYALKPITISRHLRDKHKMPIEVQKQVDQYVKKFPFTYDHASVQLPVDGLGPQPIIPIINGMACQQYTFKTQSRTRM